MQFINNAADCSIKIFMDARFDNKLERLIIEGKPTETELLNALNDIETEFNDLCGNFPPDLRLNNEINRLVARNNAVKTYFFVLDELIRRIFEPLPANAFEEAGEYLERPKAKAISIITELKKTFKVNIEWNNDISKFKQSVNNAKTREISKHVQLEEMEAELKAMLKTTPNKPVKSSKKEFYRLIHAVQNLGFKVSETETNMFSFGVMCFDYYEMVKKQGDS